jgi:hypothetical protein
LPKPWKCPVVGCRKSYSAKTAVNQHLKNNHKNLEIIQDDEKKPSDMGVLGDTPKRKLDYRGIFSEKDLKKIISRKLAIGTRDLVKFNKGGSRDNTRHLPERKA